MGTEDPAYSKLFIREDTSHTLDVSHETRWGILYELKRKLVLEAAAFCRLALKGTRAIDTYPVSAGGGYNKTGEATRTVCHKASASTAICISML